ncbi:hypothetical protein AAVH_41037 [Aphelenchoides avenae]|nr:hypothetical protein AAVH_41037 [Aphelenchus avenae]
MEPINASKHFSDLYPANKYAHENGLHLLSLEFPPAEEEAYRKWMETMERSDDPFFYAIVDKATGKAGGWQSFRRISPEHGTAEVAHVYYGPSISKTRMATEAQYLVGRLIFDELKYRRLEWECNNANSASKRAAARFGYTFEGVFRQHLIQNGKNRDTAWFAIVDKDWPVVKAAYERWLSPENFGQKGHQIRKLEDIRADILKN